MFSTQSFFDTQSLQRKSQKYKQVNERLYVYYSENQSPNIRVHLNIDKSP